MFLFLAIGWASSLLQTTRYNTTFQTKEALINHLNKNRIRYDRRRNFFIEIGNGLAESKIAYESRLLILENEIVIKTIKDEMKNCKNGASSNIGGFIDIYEPDRTFQEIYRDISTTIMEINSKLKKAIRDFTYLNARTLNQAIYTLKLEKDDKIQFSVNGKEVIVIHVSYKNKKAPVSVNYSELCTENLKIIIESVNSIQVYLSIIMQYIHTILRFKHVPPAYVFEDNVNGLVYTHGVLLTMKRGCAAIDKNYSSLRFYSILYRQLIMCHENKPLSYY